MQYFPSHEKETHSLSQLPWFFWGQFQNLQATSRKALFPNASVARSLYVNHYESISVNALSTRAATCHGCAGNGLYWLSGLDLLCEHRHQLGIPVLGDAFAIKVIKVRVGNLEKIETKPRQSLMVLVFTKVFEHVRVSKHQPTAAALPFNANCPGDSCP